MSERSILEDSDSWGVVWPVPHNMIAGRANPRPREFWILVVLGQDPKGGSSRFKGCRRTLRGAARRSASRRTLSAPGGRCSGHAKL